MQSSRLVILDCDANVTTAMLSRKTGLVAILFVDRICLLQELRSYRETTL